MYYKWYPMCQEKVKLLLVKTWEAIYAYGIAAQGKCLEKIKDQCTDGSFGKGTKKKKRRVQEKQPFRQIQKGRDLQIIGHLRFRKAFGLQTVRDKMEKDFKQ